MTIGRRRRIQGHTSGPTARILLLASESYEGTGAIDSATDLTGAGQLGYEGPGELSAVTDLTASAQPGHTGTATLTASADLTSSAVAAHAGVATLPSSATLTSAGQSVRTGTGVALASTAWLSSGFHAGGSATTLSLTTGLASAGSKGATGTAAMSSATGLTVAGTMARQGPGETIVSYTTIYLGYGMFTRSGRCIVLALTSVTAIAGPATHTGVATLSVPAPLSSAGLHAGRATGAVSVTAALSSRGHQRVTAQSEDGLTVPAFVFTSPLEGVTAPL